MLKLIRRACVALFVEKAQLFVEKHAMGALVGVRGVPMLSNSNVFLMAPECLPNGLIYGI